MVFAPIIFAAALQSTEIESQTIELPAISTRPHSTQNETGDENALLNDLNAERTKRGLGRLTLNKQLSNAAQSHSSEMANESYFGHTSPSGLTCYQRMAQFGARVNGNYSGENIALDMDVQHAEAAMMASPGHRENMLDPRYKQVGIAVVQDQDGTRYYSEDFLGDTSTYVSMAKSKRSTIRFHRMVAGNSRSPSGFVYHLASRIFRLPLQSSDRN
jgi:uncharacterized protein YkwD